MVRVKTLLIAYIRTPYDPSVDKVTTEFEISVGQAILLVIQK